MVERLILKVYPKYFELLKEWKERHGSEYKGEMRDKFNDTFPPKIRRIMKNDGFIIEWTEMTQIMTEDCNTN